MKSPAFYKIMLAPLLLAQARKMRRTALRLPEASGQRDGIVSIGNDQPELKLLFVGDSTMAGVGVQHHTSALPFQVATIVANQIRRPVRWQVVAKSGVNTSQALEFARKQVLFPADVLITALGTNDVTSQRRLKQFLDDYQALIETLSAQVGASLAIISGLPPLHLTQAAPQPLRWYLGMCARELDEGLRQWIQLQHQMGYISLQWASNPNELAADGYHPGESQYKVWADLVAVRIANLLEATTMK